MRWYVAVGPQHEIFDEAALAIERERMGRWLKFIPLARGTAIMPVHTPVSGEWVTVHRSAIDGRTILYFHGGGYSAGSPLTHRQITSRLASAAGARLFSLDYRLAPEHPFPAAIDDAVAAFEWLVDQGADPSGIALAGDSAGGGLAVATALRLRANGRPLPGALCLIAPWTDLTVSSASATATDSRDPLLSTEGMREAAAAYLAGEESRHPLASPRWADLSGLPPILIQIGDCDRLFDEAQAFADAALNAGVAVTLNVWPGMPHVWHATAPFTSAARRALREAGGWIAERIG